MEVQFARLRVAAPEALLSGDLAADRISAGRVPQHVSAYVHSVVDPAGLGFAMADDEEYTLAVTVPRDPTLWAASAAFGRAGIADPVLTAFDVLRTGTTGDEVEAAQKVLLTVERPNRSFDALAESLKADWSNEAHAVDAAAQRSFVADLASIEHTDPAVDSTSRGVGGVRGQIALDAD